MSELQKVLDQAVLNRQTPGVVAAVAGPGGVMFEGAAGVRVLGGDQPMTLDAVFRAFSMTKAVGAAAAAKAVEQGLLTLDTPVEAVLPEWRDVQVLEGFDGDSPQLRAPRSQATLRHLATHTSGLVYETWNGNQRNYLAKTGLPSIMTGQKRAFHSYPLAFDPGTNWGYGPGIDWLGRAVEVVSGKRIDAYCREHLFDPLGMSDTQFEVSDAMRPRLAEAYACAHGEWAVQPIGPPARPEVYGMGHALYATGPDYLRFIRMLLGGGEVDGVRVLQPETAAMFCANQIGALSVGKMVSIAPRMSADVDLFPGQAAKFSLGCMMNTQDIPGKRRAGSQSWAGLLNTHYWFDPAAGVAAVLMLQHIPFVDANALAIYDAFERAVYAEIG